MTRNWQWPAHWTHDSSACWCSFWHRKKSKLTFTERAETKLNWQVSFEKHWTNELQRQDIWFTCKERANGWTKVPWLLKDAKFCLLTHEHQIPFPCWKRPNQSRCCEKGVIRSIRAADSVDTTRVPGGALLHWMSSQRVRTIRHNRLQSGLTALMTPNLSATASVD